MQTSGNPMGKTLRNKIDGTRSQGTRVKGILLQHQSTKEKDVKKKMKERQVAMA